MCDFCVVHSCAHTLHLCFALHATLQLVALVATALIATVVALDATVVPLTVYVHMSKCVHFVCRWLLCSGPSFWVLCSEHLFLVDTTSFLQGVVS